VHSTRALPETAYVIRETGLAAHGKNRFLTVAAR